MGCHFKSSVAPRFRAFLACLALLAACPGLNAQFDSDDILLTPDDRIDKSPRISGDFVTWTQDTEALDSFGNVRVRHLPSGNEWDLGPGFASDVSVQLTGALGPEGCSNSEVRVAWLRIDPLSERLQLLSACLQAQTWTTVVLENSLAWAADVRVLEQFTAWSAPDASGQIKLFVHDGSSRCALSGDGHAFRAAFAFNELNGNIALLWDEYLGNTTEALNYDVFLSTYRQGAGWAPPENISQAPGSTDLAASADYAPDGALWVAWQSDRGDIAPHNFVLRRSSVGVTEHPASYPPSSDPGMLGSVAIEVTRGTFEPNLRVDLSGRVWLFAQERQGGSNGAYDKQIRYTIYDGQAWSSPQILSQNKRDERWLDLEVLDTGLFAVFQSNSLTSRSVDVASKLVSTQLAPLTLSVSPASGPVTPNTGYALPQLPTERLLVDPDGELRLVFGDLHSHTARSPDGMGALDHALFWARDFAQLDFWASTDHDERGGHDFTDWEYELGRRFVALFDSQRFVAFHGFEWTNDSGELQGEIIGHRAVIDSGMLYRNTEESADALQEFYALMAAEDALGVPHHLGKLGGASFVLWDPMVQPITEISSVHGIYEDELVEKYADNSLRFGVTAAGDNHTATPGLDGLAGLWVPANQPLSRATLKAALRSRRSFAVQHDALWVDFRVNGTHMGSELATSNNLHFTYEFRELPFEATFNVNITRNGNDTTPVHQQFFPAGSSGPIGGLAVLSGVDEPTWFMLRITLGPGSDSQDTVFWSTPVWVVPAPLSSGPEISISNPENARRQDTP